MVQADRVQVSVVQWTSENKPETNLGILRRLLQTLPQRRPQLVVIPEAFASFGAGEATQLERAEPAGDGPIQRAVAELAREFSVWIVAGTIPITAGERYHAASILFDDNGRQVARYNKIHLFDASVEDGTKEYQESRFTRPGEDIVVADTPFGRIGMAVCYDLRFPELFRALRDAGAELIVLPSAFTYVTGKAHWQPLLQARAIETQCFVLAPNQGGQHPDGRETWGHSMIIDPWGHVCAEVIQSVGVASTELNLSAIADVRKRMPVAQHNQFRIKFVGY